MVETSLAVIPRADDSKTSEKSARPAKLTLKYAQEQLDQRLNDLVDAPKNRIARVNFDIQRWRVAVRLLEERESKEIDPKIYNEMALLQRMAKQLDAEEDIDEEATRRLRTAREKLEDAGITPQGARTVVELFERALTPDGPRSEPDA